MIRFPFPSTLALYTSMGLLSARLQEMMGDGLPVATHSRTTVWWRDVVTFCGPAMIRGLWRALGPESSQESRNVGRKNLEVRSSGIADDLPLLTVSVASLLFERLPMLVATHRYCPASSSCTLWIWSTPLGNTVILSTSKHQIMDKIEGILRKCYFVTNISVLFRDFWI